MTSRDPLAQAQVDAANHAFYRAFEQADIRQMEQIWAHAEHVRCVHPGWSLIEGWPAVRRSWALVFEGGSGMRIQIDRVVVRAGVLVGWVTCVERIVTRSAAGPVANEILATNVFERAGPGHPWRMVLHHASPVMRDMTEMTAPGSAAPGELN